MKLKLAVGCLAALSACAIAAPAAVATAPAPMTCNGQIADQVVNAPVVVPAGATCAVVRSTLRRGITAESGARALALRESKVLLRIAAPSVQTFTLVNTQVLGRVEQGGSASTVTVCGAEILGAARLSGNAFAVRFGAPALSTCAKNEVTGALTLEGNPGQGTIDDTTVNGLLRIVDNPGTVTLSDVTVNGLLACSGNATAPAVGPGVQAQHRIGQCAAA